MARPDFSFQNQTMEGLMSTNATEEARRKAEVPMGELAKDVGLEHKVGPDQGQGSVRQAIGKLFGRLQSGTPKNR
jgi:hypothetical protein